MTYHTFAQATRIWEKREKKTDDLQRLLALIERATADESQPKEIYLSDLPGHIPVPVKALETWRDEFVKELNELSNQFDSL